MQKIFVIIVSLVIYKLPFAQAQKFIVDFEVGFLKFKNDSIQFRSPRTFSIRTSGCTDIFSLGKSRQYEFGMKLEILVSKLTGKEKYLVGKVYYVKNNNEWQEVMKIEHQELGIQPITQREKTDTFIMGGGSTDYPDTFDVRLNDNYYIMQ